MLNWGFRWITDLLVFGFLAAFCYVYYSSGTPAAAGGQSTSAESAATKMRE